METQMENPSEKERAARMLSVLASMGMDRSAISVLAEFADIELSTDDRRFLEGPLVLHQSAWNDTLPDWVAPQVAAERAEIVLKQRPMPVGPTEIMAVMYGAMLDAPRPHNTSELYLWASANAAAHHYKRDIAEIWQSLDMPPITDRDVVDRSGRLYHDYAALAAEIRRKVIAAQKQREPRSGKAKKALPPSKLIESQQYQLLLVHVKVRVRG
jgi:hypothetical protein